MKQQVSRGGASYLGDGSGLTKAGGAAPSSQPLRHLAHQKHPNRWWEFVPDPPQVRLPPLAGLHSPLHCTQCFSTIPMADPTPRFGFVAFAETWNGRLAMLGFVIGLATEVLTGQGILTQIGLG
jgi:hypothetical protein